MDEDNNIDLNEVAWADYLLECRALEAVPSLSDFSIYLQENDLDD